MRLDLVFAALSATPVAIQALLEELPGDIAEVGTLDSWGPRHVVSHLIDVETTVFRERIGRILTDDRPFIRSIDPSSRLTDGDHLRKPVPELLEQFANLRRESLTWLRSLPEERLDRAGTHDEAGTITASGLIHYWACHDLVHLRQVEGAIQLALEPFLGNTRSFFEEV